MNKSIGLNDITIEFDEEDTREEMEIMQNAIELAWNIIKLKRK